MALVNNYGMGLMYTFNFMTNPLDYEVRNVTMPDEIWAPMKREEICNYKGTDLKYRPIVSSPKYINGFYNQLDMICWKKSEIAFIVS